MKKITITLGVLLAFFLTGCSGSDGYDGLDGRDGADGEDGVNITGSIYEIEGDFSINNDYSLYYEFPKGPNDVEVFESSIVLVYILWDQTVDTNGDAVDIWRLLPQATLLEEGFLQYNFDHTFLDVSIFMEAEFDIAILDASYTDNQVFRIAILPAAMASGKLNKSNINDVMGVLGVTEEKIARVTL
ncbi:collagen-like protein [Cellulophaga sp. F20128]|uniref:collagen-like protein n=1 Tax=Cellulophaga sp. F20128 TaxID=2926413 RepID=UPI001FF349D3|nr:collagen-like protein [Cellulophaga sp. F20128]MCK0157527.1 collagen-like protein [Cellulophaga sp. F20128]